MNLELAGIEYDKKGIKVDKTLRTTNKNVYAVGDCIEGFKFTHNSDIQARYVIYNALLFSSKDYTKIILPYATYTSPEVAQVGYNTV
jgi:pyruvate/2-oxoglutarate dehydrogenase complex dihydrolipoamide dehydrogenase (E3) component